MQTEYEKAYVEKINQDILTYFPIYLRLKQI